MKKIIIFCFLALALNIFGYSFGNGAVKKESIENTNNSGITLKELMKDEKFIQFARNYINKDYVGLEENFVITYDEFNLENKLIHKNVKPIDKIQLEVFEKYSDDDSFKASDYDTRGNIIFVCPSKNYFSFNKIIILTDKNRYEIKGNIFAHDTKFSGNGVTQIVKYQVDQDKFNMLLDIAESKKVRIRFTKNDNNLDFTLNDREKKNLTELVLNFKQRIILKKLMQEFLNNRG